MNTITIDGIKTPILDDRNESHRELRNVFLGLYGQIATPFFNVQKVEAAILRHAVRTKDKDWQAQIDREIPAPALGFDIESVDQLASLCNCLTGKQLSPDCLRLAGRAGEIVALLVPKVLQICICDIPYGGGDNYLNIPLLISEDALRFDFYSRN